jgi:ditrans,polycis-polyprenyl diphosphate synthase
MNKLIKKLISKVFVYGSNIPRSVAIIMDGNRRYADKKKLEKIKGHEDGLTKLLDVLQWCIDLEIKELTVFAFSIDNFNRPKNEFEALMNLAKEKFTKLSEKGELFQQYGVSICFYGNLQMLDDDLKDSFYKMEIDTKDNNILKLNVCFAYNSTEEIYQGIEKIREEGKTDTKSFDSVLYGGYNCNPDILIRTSGEIRLSNFLLYQTRFSMLFFEDKYWPDFNFYDFVKIILKYNIDYKSHIRAINELLK